MATPYEVFRKKFAEGELFPRIKREFKDDDEEED